MNRTYSYFEYKKALLHYSTYGNGNEVLVCFHGFGQSNENFKVLEEVLKNKYTIYSFDLFYHGKSFWHEKDKALAKEFWGEIVESFIREKGIGKFSLLGFSMGGKFVLATLERFYKQIDKVILIAPDGIKTSFWYSLATYPFWMQKIFRKIILQPNIYLKIVRFLSFFHIVDKGILRFANTQMLTKEQRRRVYYSWMVFKDLKFEMRKIAFILNENNIKLEMFLGEYDKIITQENMGRLLRLLTEYSINILKAGHTNLIEAVANYYKKNQ